MMPKINHFIIIALLIGMMNGPAAFASLTLSSGNGLNTSNVGRAMVIGSGIRSTGESIYFDPILPPSNIISGNILLGGPPNFDELIAIENVLDNIGPGNVNLVNVTGNLFIDFQAVSSSTAKLDPGPDRFYKFSSDTLFIDVNLDEINENPYELFEIIKQPLALDLTGNFLFYSKSQLESTTFAASGTIYIGDFSHLTPVPNPSSTFSLSMGLIFLCLIRFKKNNPLLL